MEIKLIKTEKSTAYIEILASAKEVTEEETHTLAHMAEETTIKGFRKGKAPLNVVKNSLDPEKLKQRTVTHLLGHAIDQAIKDLKLKVIANPRLVKEDTLKPDWTFTLEFPLYPQFELGDYQPKVKAALKTLPAQIDDKQPGNNDKRLKVTFDTLLDTVKMEIPQALLDEEVNRSLSRLVSQTESLNLTIEDYLKSIKKTPQSLREEYQKTAAESLKLDFLLFAIARDQKLTVSEDEVKSLQGAAQVKETDRPYLESVLLKRKAVDSLLKL
jgi:FKBP-type peptidyl-prolyl cis-trans isomerase (trigger factor)